MTIPELRTNEKIAKWKPLFDAATAGIRATDGGGKKALQMLPVHICRTLAERELVIEVVSEHLDTDVEAALSILIQNLDPPPDPHRALQTLCRMDWSQGEEVDVFFYKLKGAGTEAKAPMRMICSILVGQLPEPAQLSVKEWLEREEAEITTTKGREFILKIKNVLREKGYSSDFGYRDIGRISTVSEEIRGKGAKTCKSGKIDVSEVKKCLDEESPELEEEVFRLDRVPRGRGTTNWRKNPGTNQGKALPPPERDVSSADPRDTSCLAALVAGRKGTIFVNVRKRKTYSIPGGVVRIPRDSSCGISAVRQ